MAIPRCEHGVYSPDGDGLPSKYCSGCFTPTASLAALVVGTQDEEEEEAEVLCPRCWVPIFIEDEYDFECTNCGFNGINGI